MVDPDVSQYCLRLGDDALVLAQRLCEWAARSPQLEEDVALMNLALDLLGQSRSLLTLAGAREGAGRDEDDLAFLRDEPDFVNAQLVELENGDFGRTMAKQLLVSAYALPLWQALCGSTDADLAAIAGKAVKEVAYHLDHARSWVVRLGDGTEESHLRMQKGLDEVWPYAFELFESDPLLDRLVARGVAADPAALQPFWRSCVEEVLAEATLSVPSTDWRPSGGRRGTHTESFGYLLAEMQHLHRSHPGVSW
ncbi:MAG: phenylacetate-CoA oxygenase, PaaI subunit [Frankiales bacterium]|jgi:ring-1,2-phenylacetyl-CoA epoxidase subunit PaaC|nr:phenylacetate-CoA oxygenase, PaaI subunit [Frankiales bacterium]